MSWNIKLSEVSTQNETIQEGKYTFQVNGAQVSEDGHRLIVKSSVTSEGPFKGRRVSFSFPDPEVYPKATFVPKCLKRLEQALGVDKDDAEDMPEYLNRVAGNRFVSNIQHRKYTPEGGSEQVYAEVNIFNFEPAA